MGHIIIDYEKRHDLQAEMPMEPLVVTHLEGLKIRAGNSIPPKNWLSHSRSKDTGISALEEKE